MPNRIQDLLGVTYPVVQAPMTYIARAELAAAVSAAGGLGVIETISPGGRADLLRVRELTDRPVAANLMIQGWKNDPSIVDILAGAGVRYVFSSAGDPAVFTDRLHDAGMVVVHVVGSVRAAEKAVAAGVDALVVEGVEGGGFKSRHGASTMVLLPAVAERFDIPLIAAGGICDGRSAAAAVVLGAEGVQMGTRMLSSVESGVHGNYKDAVLAAADDGTRLLSLPGNPTMRVLHRGMAVELAGATESPPLLGRITELYFEGDFGASVGNCGQVSARIAEILPVATIVEETWRGAQAALDAGLARLR
ncbi:MAG: nitronate monooxygenase [Mycobacterium sp.]|nr:nitronate monooxygenase [Mycobacterium sp.]